jgi:hypothetical protein
MVSDISFDFIVNPVRVISGKMNSSIPSTSSMSERIFFLFDSLSSQAGLLD